MRPLLLVLLVLLAAGHRGAAQTDCVPVVNDDATRTAYVFDFSALYHEPGHPDYLHATDADLNYYYLNFCGETALCGDDAAVCLATRAGANLPCGRLATQHWALAPVPGRTPGHDVTVTYTGGATCSNSSSNSTSAAALQGQQQHSMTVHLHCDPAAAAPVVGDVATGADGCAHTLHINCSQACGNRTDYRPPARPARACDPAAVVLLVVLGAAVLYLAGGAVYQRVRHGAATPRELLVHNAFWCALPGLVRDGARFLVRFATGETATTAAGGEYTQAPEGV